MTRRVLLSAFAAGAILQACGPRAPATDSSNPAQMPAEAAAGSPLASSLNVTVSEGVRFAFHVTNASGDAIELVFPSGQTHDFAVLDSAGRELWRWSAGRMFTQAIQTKLLRAGETLTYENRWETTPPRGRFTAVATLRALQHPLEQRAEFVVP